MYTCTKIEKLVFTVLEEDSILIFKCTCTKKGDNSLKGYIQDFLLANLSLLQVCSIEQIHSAHRLSNLAGAMCLTMFICKDVHHCELSNVSVLVCIIKASGVSKEINSACG